MAEQEVTLRTKYRYKPENGDKYLTLYFESGSNDVIIDTDIAGVSSEGKTNLTDVLVAINSMVQQRALLTIYDTSKSLTRKNPVLAQGQFGVESDTMRLKIGDGNSTWTQLKYFNTGSGGSDEPTDYDTYPIGTIIQPSGSTIIPDGYLECNGREISRAGYPELFAVIGTRYGEGDGVTTFNIPLLMDIDGAYWLIKAKPVGGQEPDDSHNPDNYPIGATIYNDGEYIPDGYLECDGREISRTEYKDLFAAIGTTYGEGDGITTFNIPLLMDISGRYWLIRADLNLKIIDIVIDETSQVTAKIGDQDITLNLDNLQAATEIPEGARAYVQIIDVSEEDPS